MPRVSIVMPTYNCAAYIPESIQSVLNQDFQDFELIIVDDGSTDDTENIVSYFEDVLKDRLIYIKTENQGASQARNTALKSCRGEFIAFLDADDIWMSKKLSTQLKVFEQFSDIALVFSDALIVDASGKSFNKNYIKPWEINLPAREIYGQILAKRNFIPFSTIITKKSIINDIGVFDDAFKSSQDTDWLLRIAVKYEIKAVNETLSHYRVHPTAISRNIGLRKHDTIAILLKNLNLETPLSPSIKKEIRTRIAENYYEWGYDEFEHNRFSNAREKFICSMHYSATRYPEKYYYSFLTLLPLNIIERLRTVKRKVITP